MGHHAELEVPPRTRRALTIVAAVLGVATLLGIVVLWPSSDPSATDVDLNLIQDVYEAEVVSQEQVPCEGTTEADDVDCIRTEFELHQGPDAGEVITIELGESVTTPDLDPGDTVVLSYLPDAAPGFEYQYADRQRRPVLLAVAIVFALAVVLLGRLRGLAALAGLAASLIVLLRFVLPAILDGTSPVLVAVVGASAIAYLALYLAHGFQPMTTVALLGTLSALAVTVALAAIFTSLGEFTGLVSEEAALVQFGRADLDLSGLVLGSIVIGALGALDDMTVTQASAVWELRVANPGFSRRHLTRAALRIGRDHVASTVNTLALAYAGASLPLLILFTQSQQSLGTVANSEVVATEIVRALVGSIGLVASVPITTWLAARVAPGPVARAVADAGPSVPPQPPLPAEEPGRRIRPEPEAPAVPESPVPPTGDEAEFWRR